jgi:hypothetical protein
MENIGDQLHMKSPTELKDNSQAATFGIPLPQQRFMLDLYRCFAGRGRGGDKFVEILETLELS